MTPSSKEIRTALAKILSSQCFAQSERHRSLLRYLVEQALAGNGDRIKGYTIAVEVFGRKSDFDAATDPYVRVEAGRLRKRLKEYYADEGASDSLRIRLTPGSYAPTFAYTQSRETGPGATIERAPQIQWLRRPELMLITMLLAAMLVTAAIGVTSRFRNPAAPDIIAAMGPPKILVTAPRIGDSQGGTALSGDFIDELFYALSSYATLLGPVDVLTDDPATGEAPADYDYRIEASLPRIGSNASPFARVFDADTQRLVLSIRDIGSGPRSIPADEDALRMEYAQFAQKLVNAIRDPFGDFAAAEFDKLAGRELDSLSAYECAVLGLNAMKMLLLASRAEARLCLERHRNQNSLDSSGFAILAYLYNIDYQDGQDFRTGAPPAHESALAAARHAIDLDSGNLFALGAMTTVQLSDHKLADARRTLDRALSTHPPPSALGLSSSYIFRLAADEHERNQVWAHFRAAVEAGAKPTAALNVGMVMLHLDEGNYASALALIEEVSAQEFTMVPVLRAAVAALAGEPGIAQHAVDTIDELHPEFAGYALEVIRRWSLPASTEEKLLAGLHQAGLVLSP